MDIERLEPLTDVVAITPKRFGDHRGFFSETYSARAFTQAGIDATFVQDNHSLSRNAGVVRGLHFQAPPRAQGKLIRVIRGAIYDVAVDIRHGSPTYGQSVGLTLSADNWRQLWIPAGFAHGFCTLEPDTEVTYKVTDDYAPETEGGLLWNDPALGIDWPIAEDGAILSDKDLKNPPLAAFETPFR